MREKERMERNRLRARNRMISGLARDFVHRCIQFDIHQYLASSSSWYFVSLTRWAKPQTCKPHSLEARKTTIDSYLNYMNTRADTSELDSGCTHVDLRPYLYTLVIFQRKPRSQESVHSCSTQQIYSSYDRLFSFSWLRNCRRSKDKGRISRSSYAWLFHVLIFIRGDLQSGIRKGGRRENPLIRIYSTLVG